MHVGEVHRYAVDGGSKFVRTNERPRIELRAVPNTSTPRIHPNCIVILLQLLFIHVWYLPSPREDDRTRESVESPPTTTSAASSHTPLQNTKTQPRQERMNVPTRPQHTNKHTRPDPRRSSTKPRFAPAPTEDKPNSRAYV